MVLGAEVFHRREQLILMVQIDRHSPNLMCRTPYQRYCSPLQMNLKLNNRVRVDIFKFH